MRDVRPELTFEPSAMQKSLDQMPDVPAKQHACVSAIDDDVIRLPRQAGALDANDAVARRGDDADFMANWLGKRVHEAIGTIGELR